MKRLLMTTLTALFLGMAWAQLPADEGAAVRLSDFMDPQKTDNECIDNCLDFCSALPRRTIVFDVPQLSVDRAILLPSHTRILLQNCTIRQKDFTFDNVFRGANMVLRDNDYAYLPQHIEPLCDISIIGDGNSCIEGCRQQRRYVHPVKGEQDMVGDFYGLRTHMINFSRLDGGEISGISFTLTRGWCISFDFSTNLYLHHLEITSNVKNGDGINFRAGCKHCRVEHLTAHTSDDAVACTALGDTTKRAYPIDNYLFPSEGTAHGRALIVGSDRRLMDIEDISISHVRVTATAIAGHAAICLAADGNRVHHILMNDIVEEEGTRRNSLIMLYTGYSSHNLYREGDISNICLNGISSVSARHTLECNCQVLNVRANKLENRTNPADITLLTYPENIQVTNSGPAKAPK